MNPQTRQNNIARLEQIVLELDLQLSQLINHVNQFSHLLEPDQNYRIQIQISHLINRIRDLKYQLRQLKGDQP